METAKLKINIAFQEYKRLFPEEFEQFKKSNAVTINKQTNKMASREGAIERHLFDIPEKLYQAITLSLTVEELNWWKASGEYKKDFRGVQWFLKTYPVFKVTESF